jgi:hypothetical protein
MKSILYYNESKAALEKELIGSRLDEKNNKFLKRRRRP